MGLLEVCCPPLREPRIRAELRDTNLFWVPIKNRTTTMPRKTKRVDVKTRRYWYRCWLCHNSVSVVDNSAWHLDITRGSCWCRRYCCGIIVNLFSSCWHSRRKLTQVAVDFVHFWVCRMSRVDTVSQPVSLCSTMRFWKLVSLNSCHWNKTCLLQEETKRDGCLLLIDKERGKDKTYIWFFFVEFIMNRWSESY